MTTQIIQITDPLRQEEALRTAAAILRRGGLVVFPTETVYGLGGNGTDAAAAQKIYAAKGRPSDNPLIIHIASPEDAALYAETNPTYRRLARAFMPGPLTVILPRRDCIPTSVTGGLQTVAVRCPAHPVAHRLIELCGFPIAAPSANLSGKPSPTCASDVIQDLSGRVDMILDGGDCDIGLESTIVAVNPDESLTLLRPGGITYNDLLTVCPKVTLAEAVTHQLAEGERPLSPGMKYRHYAPAAPLILLSGEEQAVLRFLRSEQEKRPCAILCYEEEMPCLLPNRLIPIGKKSQPQELAHRLFHALRMADQTGAEVIYAHLPSQDGIGLALYNRMIRAAAHTVLQIP